jgi:hypothetical protein
MDQKERFFVTSLIPDYVIWGGNNGYSGLIINVTDPRITAKNNQFPCTIRKYMKTVLLVMFLVTSYSTLAQSLLGQLAQLDHLEQQYQRQQQMRQQLEYNKQLQQFNRQQQQIQKEQQTSQKLQHDQQVRKKKQQHQNNSAD